MARRSPQTQAKRERELAKARKRKDKIARREQRKALREQAANNPDGVPDTDQEGATTDEPEPSEPAPRGQPD